MRFCSTLAFMTWAVTSAPSRGGTQLNSESFSFTTVVYSLGQLTLKVEQADIRTADPTRKDLWRFTVINAAPIPLKGNIYCNGLCAAVRKDGKTKIPFTLNGQALEFSRDYAAGESYSFNASIAKGGTLGDFAGGEYTTTVGLYAVLP